MTNIETIGNCKLFVDLHSSGNFLVVIGGSAFRKERFETHEKAVAFANLVTAKPFRFEREDCVEFDGQIIACNAIVRFATRLEAETKRKRLMGNGWHCNGICDDSQAA